MCNAWMGSLRPGGEAGGAWTRLCALLCALALLAPGSALASDAVEKLEDQAYEAYKSGDLESALRFYREAHKLDPAPALLNNIARVSEDLGLYRDAYDAYELVVNDPEADPNTRSRDAARMALLAPRLAHGWLKLTATPEDATLLVGGDKPRWGGDDEAQVTPGDHPLEVTSGSLGVTRVWVASMPAGRRVNLSADLNDPDGADAHIVFAQMPNDLTSVSVDGYTLRTPPTQWMKLHLPPGTHEITLGMAGGDERTFKEPLVAGSTVGVHILLERARNAASPPGASIASPAPRSSTLSWGLVGAGGASVVGAVVVGLMRQGDLRQMAEAEDRFNDSTLDASLAAEAFGEAMAAQEAADAKRIPLVALSVAGVGLTAAGLVLLLTGDSPPDQTADGVQITPLFSPHSVGLRGSF